MSHARDLQNRHVEELYFARIGCTPHGRRRFASARTAAARSPREPESGDPDRLVCDRCGFVFYLDPKVAVGTIIDDGEGRIVLVKRRHRARLRQVGVPRRLRRSRRAACSGRPSAKHARSAASTCASTAWSTSTRTRDVRRSSSCTRRAWSAATWRWTRRASKARWFAAGDVPWDELAFRSTRGALAGLSSPDCATRSVAGAVSWRRHEARRLLRRAGAESLPSALVRQAFRLALRGGHDAVRPADLRLAVQRPGR